MSVASLRVLPCIPAALVLAAAAFLSAQPNQARAEITAPFVNVVAVGDSFTAGVGGGDYYGDDQCVRSPHSWAQQWVNRRIQAGDNIGFSNKACSGNVISNLFRHNANGELEISDVDGSVDILLMTIGGNNLGFSDVALHCLIAPEAMVGDDCRNDVATMFRKLGGGTEAYFGDNKLASLEDALKTTFVKAGESMHSGARIVYLGYPELVRIIDGSDPCVDSKRCQVKTDDFRRAARLFEELQRRAVDAANKELLDRQVVVTFVDSVRDRFKDHEPLLGEASDPAALLWDPVGSGAASFPPPIMKVYRDHPNWYTYTQAWAMGFFHPKVAGYQAEAELVDAAGGDYLFGVSTAQRSASFSLDGPLVGNVGESVTVHFRDEVVDVGKRYWLDLNGDRRSDVSEYSAISTYTPQAPFEGYVTALLYAGGQAYEATIWVHFSADGDHDGVQDSWDNCPDVVNLYQWDSDSDGLGALHNWRCSWGLKPPVSRRLLAT